MKAKIKWGILSTAKIAVQKVIPAMQQGKYIQVDAIASRDVDKANKIADQLNIKKRYGSYEELLQDPEIDAIYNPWKTRFLREAQERGCSILNGLTMLLYQALESFYYWTDTTVDPSLYSIDELQRLITH